MPKKKSNIKVPATIDGMKVKIPAGETSESVKTNRNRMNMLRAAEEFRVTRDPKAEKKARNLLKKETPARSAQSRPGRRIGLFNIARSHTSDVETSLRTGKNIVWGRASSKKLKEKRDIRTQRKAQKAKVRAAQVRLKIEPIVDSPPISESGKPFRFNAKQGNKAIMGTGIYRGTDKEISILGIGPKGDRRPYGEMHKEVANKTMTPGFIRGTLKELKKRFPAAEKVVGFRVTGSKGNVGSVMRGPATSTNLQQFSLKGMAKAASKATKGFIPYSIFSGAKDVRDQVKNAEIKRRRLYGLNTDA